MHCCHYDSVQSKLVKRGTAKLCLPSAFMKYCPHVMQDNLNDQVRGLFAAGYPCTVVMAIAGVFLHEEKAAHSKVNPGLHRRGRPEVMP